MSSKWKEVARMRFKGERFDRALDASALGEVQRYLRIIEETAKALWRADHPDRERLPAGFEQASKAYLRALRPGSSVAVIESRVDDADQMEFLDRGAEAMVVAAEFTHKAFDAVARSRPLPEQLPRDLLTEFIDLGKSLQPDEMLEIKASSRKRFVAYRPEYRQRLQAHALQPYEADFTLTGEIIEADVRQKRFQVWTDRTAAIAAPFKPEQEESVTTALKDHHALRVRVSGRCVFSADGKPSRFVDVASLLIRPVEDEYLFDPNAVSVEDEIEAIWKDVSQEEWSRLPTDLSRNIDHYLYGAPKQ